MNNTRPFFHHFIRWRGIKVGAILVIIAFLLPDLNWAFEMQAQPLPAPGFHLSHFARPLKIPQPLGTIIREHEGNEKTVICVQDLHCNYEIQKNIAKIIGKLAREYKLKLVGEEGAVSKVDTSALRDFPVTKIREMVGDNLLRQGRITGAEYYSALGDKPIDLQGIEQATLYDASLKQVRSFLNSECQGYLYDLREQLDQLKPAIYDQALQQFDRECSKYRQGAINTLRHATYLHAAAMQAGIGTQAYPNLERYLSLRQHSFSGQVDAEGLFAEVDQLEQAVRTRLHRTDSQRALDAMEQRLTIMEKLLNISATQEELQTFRTHRQNYTVKAVVNFIQAKSAAGPLIDPDVYALDGFLGQVEKFYQLADSRSRAFVDVISAKMEAQGEKLALITTGGFHTDKILQQLDRRGFSYVAIKPRLTRQDVANPYFTLLRNRETPLEKLLAKNQTLFAVPTGWDSVAFQHWVALGSTLLAVFLEKFRHIPASIDAYCRQHGIAGAKVIATADQAAAVMISGKGNQPLGFVVHRLATKSPHEEPIAEDIMVRPVTSESQAQRIVSKNIQPGQQENFKTKISKMVDNIIKINENSSSTPNSIAYFWHLFWHPWDRAGAVTAGQQGLKWELPMLLLTGVMAGVAGYPGWYALALIAFTVAHQLLNWRANLIRGPAPLFGDLAKQLAAFLPYISLAWSISVFGLMWWWVIGLGLLAAGVHYTHDLSEFNQAMELADFSQTIATVNLNTMQLAKNKIVVADRIALLDHMPGLRVVLLLFLGLIKKLSNQATAKPANTKLQHTVGSHILKYLPVYQFNLNDLLRHQGDDGKTVEIRALDRQVNWVQYLFLLMRGRCWVDLPSTHHQGQPARAASYALYLPANLCQSLVSDNVEQTKLADFMLRHILALAGQRYFGHLYPNHKSVNEIEVLLAGNTQLEKELKNQAGDKWQDILHKYASGNQDAGYQLMQWGLLALLETENEQSMLEYLNCINPETAVNISIDNQQYRLPKIIFERQDMLGLLQRKYKDRVAQTGNPFDLRTLIELFPFNDLLAYSFSVYLYGNNFIDADEDQTAIKQLEGAYIPYFRKYNVFRTKAEKMLKEPVTEKQVEDYFLELRRLADIAIRDHNRLKGAFKDEKHKEYLDSGVRNLEAFKAIPQQLMDKSSGHFWLNNSLSNMINLTFLRYYFRYSCKINGQQLTGADFKSDFDDIQVTAIRSRLAFLLLSILAPFRQITGKTIHLTTARIGRKVQVHFKMTWPKVTDEDKPQEIPAEMWHWSRQIADKMHGVDLKISADQDSANYFREFIITINQNTLFLIWFQGKKLVAQLNEKISPILTGMSLGNLKRALVNPWLQLLMVGYAVKVWVTKSPALAGNLLNKLVWFFHHKVRQPKLRRIRRLFITAS